MKSGILLAGLAAPGETSVIEPAPSRDHSERMLRHFGAEVRLEEEAAGGLFADDDAPIEPKKKAKKKTAKVEPVAAPDLSSLLDDFDD